VFCVAVCVERKRERARVCVNVSVSVCLCVCYEWAHRGLLRVEMAVYVCVSVYVCGVCVCALSLAHRALLGVNDAVRALRQLVGEVRGEEGLALVAADVQRHLQLLLRGTVGSDSDTQGLTRSAPTSLDTKQIWTHLLD
jgi:hypothetical protein